MSGETSWKSDEIKAANIFLTRRNKKGEEIRKMAQIENPFVSTVKNMLLG